MKGLDVQALIGALRAVLPEPGSVELHEPKFGGNEWRYLKECLDSGWVSSVGGFVDEFERRLAEFTGARYAVATVNGTSALHACLRLVGVSDHDEVLVPSLTFIATAAAVTYCGATPHFVDSEDTTLGVDVGKLEDHLRDVAHIKNGMCINRVTGARIKAVVPVHTFGHPVDMDALVEVANRFALDVVEDAAESLGSYYKGRHTGNWGRVSALSFNGNKVVTTGGGGAIVTNDARLAEQAKHVTATARVRHQWSFVHDQVGYNYRMPNLNAALGCAQLEQLPAFLQQKRRLAERYRAAIAAVKGVRFFSEPQFASSNYWLNTLILDDKSARDRDLVLQATHEQGIKTRPAWVPMHRLEMFQDCPRMDLSMTDRLERTIVNIPSSPFLAQEHG